MRRAVPLLAKLTVLAAAHTLLSGFVLLSRDGDTLPVSPDDPTLTFHWDGQAPTLQQKDGIPGGDPADSDHDAFAKIITQAMASWSNVAGSYVKLKYTEDPSAVIDPTDKQFSIVLKPLSNASEGAFAAPQIPTDNSKTITDCDIDVPPTAVPSTYMLHTITHELGHCLGLGHAHTNYAAIMGYSGSTNQIKLGADDMAGVIYLYPDPNDPNYKKAQELVNVCGVVGGAAAARQGWLMALLFAPLALIFLKNFNCKLTSILKYIKVN